MRIKLRDNYFLYLKLDNEYTFVELITMGKDIVAVITMPKSPIPSEKTCQNLKANLQKTQTEAKVVMALQKLE